MNTNPNHERKSDSESAKSTNSGSSWTDLKNERRCELIDKEIAQSLSNEERSELDALQAEMLAFRRQVAPLPLNDLRALHQQLLRDASGTKQG
jgi:hypothetical protein